MAKKRKVGKGAEVEAGATEVKNGTSNVRVKALRPLLPPACLIEELPVPTEVADMVSKAREEVGKILLGEDDRLLVVVGPCSIHDPKAVMEYAHELKKMADEHKGELLVVMRCYPSKPRSTVGWKGLIYDPDLDGSFNINKGLRLTRQLLLDINKLGLPIGTEFLDTISPQFTSDLIAWGAIGARTTESQVHRELASGLSCPIGFKNGTGGDIQVAIDAVQSSSCPHSFLGVTEQGLSAIVSTTGNEFAHVILRGGSDGPNYEKEHVEKCQAMLDKKDVKVGIVVDCSHGNSNKDHKNQPLVAQNLAEQVKAGSKSVVGLMLESNINEGNQKLDIGVTNPSKLKYGVSVTDACIDIPTTKDVLANLAEAVKARRK